MGADPATGALVAAAAPAIIGGKELGGQAPSPGGIGGSSPGGIGGSGGLLGGDLSGILPLLPSLLLNQGSGGVQGALEESGVASTGPREEVGPPESRAGAGEQAGLLGKFFNNLDTTFSSPSKQLGLGLLGNINPALGGAGLLASGLFGKKLFGGQ